MVATDSGLGQEKGVGQTNTDTGQLLGSFWAIWPMRKERFLNGRFLVSFSLLRWIFLNHFLRNIFNKLDLFSQFLLMFWVIKKIVSYPKYCQHLIFQMCAQLAHWMPIFSEEYRWSIRSSKYANTKSKGCLWGSSSNAKQDIAIIFTWVEVGGTVCKSWHGCV